MRRIALFYALVAVMAGATPAMAARDVPQATSADACRRGQAVTGRGLERSMLTQSHPFRVTMPLSAGAEPIEVIFIPGGRFYTGRGDFGQWELTDNEGLMTSGPGPDKAMFLFIRRHEGQLWGCAEERSGVGYRLTPG